MSSDRYNAIFTNPRVESEIRDFEEWLNKYGEHLLAYEPSKIVVRTAWVVRIALDEAYRSFPGEEKELREYVASYMREKLLQHNVPVEAITRGDIHGTRQDVVEVLKNIFPNLSQTQRPSLPVILREEEEKKTHKSIPVPPTSRRELYLSKYIYAWIATLLISALLILLLTRI